MKINLGITESNMATATVFSVFSMIPWMAFISWICSTIGVKKYDGCAILGTLFIALPLTFSLLIWLHKKYIDDPEESIRKNITTKNTTDAPMQSDAKNTNISYAERYAGKTFIIGMIIWAAITIMTNIDENITAFILRSLGSQTDSMMGSVAKMAAFFSGYIVILFVLAGSWYGYVVLKGKTHRDVNGKN